MNSNTFPSVLTQLNSIKELIKQEASLQNISK